MYSSRGNSAYGQQSYGGQSGYAQNLGSAYTPSSVGGIDGGSQHSLASRHSSMLSGSQEADVGGYRGSTAHYGGQYGAIYGSASMTGSQQAPSMSAKVTGASALEGRGGYTSALPDSPKFSSGEYVPSSSHAYGHKSDQLYPEKIHDYSAIDRRQYGERQSAYMGMDIQSDTVSRYADSVGFSHQHQPGIYERIDQASLLRQEQLLKSQSVQSSSLDATSRQIDYLAARSTASRHPTQDLASYGGRMDADPRNSSMLSTSSYGGQHAPSILGAAPRRNVDDLLYPQSSSNPGYGVSLPPGRDYGTGKGLHGASLESDYRGGHSRIDERRDDRAGYLREFELREEERHRDLVREREKERDREKERERERDRERERKRERERILERREKERERERKRGLEIRRERTPPSASKDRRGTSVTKEARTLRRDSSSHETSHRRHSPVKEKRREYICKIHSSSLVDTERDYLSVDKRYPRLFISPEFSKVIVNWPKENLKLSIQTPVSFEHDFLEEDGVAELKESPSTNLSAQQLVKPEPGRTIWHAKILLMSGLSKNALEELSSEKCYDDRPLHVCNIMRFAVLKRDRSFMAIGGPWDPADGGDPSVDDSVLVQTALRYARDITQIDLKNCRNWNRFLEIHYDRFGSDGFFSHREITVLFVPDLSECLPSLETWRNQWLAHKRTVAERERQLILKRERSREKKEGQKGTDSSKDSKRTEKSEKTKEPTSAGVKKNDKDVKGKATAQKDDDSDKNSVNKDETETGEGAKKVVKEQGDTSGTQTTTIVKAGKKKIIRRIVKQKVAASKTTDAVTTAAKNNEDGKNAAENNEKSEISAEQNESSADPSGVKTFVRKKIIKKVQVGKSIENKDKGLQPEVTTEKVVEDKPKDNSETKSVALVQGSAVKTAVKKKIIKRVLKRKLTGGAATSEIKTDEKIVAQAGHETEKTGAQNVAKDVQKAEIKVILKSPTADKQTEIKAVKEEKKDGKEIDGKGSSGKKIEGAADKQKSIQKEDHDGKRVKSKDDEKSKDEKKDKDGKDEAKGKSTKDIKEKRLLEEPPKHPGVIFQLKGNKEAKLRSLSLSLDSLLDYSDNDIEESTFELSLFAESFYEMLQYEMASRILTFLQKLRIKFVTKRNQKKRLREEMEEKDKERNRSAKKLKTNELHVITKAVDPESTDHPEDQNTEKKKSTEKNQNTVKKEDVSVDKVNEEKLEEEIDYEEDPEEDPEEDEEMEDPEEDSSDEKTKEDEKPNLDVEDATVNGKEKEKEKAEENSKETKTEEAKPVSDIVSSEKKQDAKVESGKKEPSTVKEAVIDKELLQAFRFFDRNRTGYIRVEDMRLIIHNMRKYFSHRDVKELVQSALLETNTGRDNHILYGKLVRMTNI